MKKKESLAVLIENWGDATDLKEAFDKASLKVREQFFALICKGLSSGSASVH